MRARHRDHPDRSPDERRPEDVKKIILMAACVASLGVPGAALTASPAVGSSLCVGSKPGCFATIQAAVDAAHDGDTIAIAPGNYAGGILIAKSVTLAGAGSTATVIAGGGPVVTIGDGVTAPTVSISRVTVTGGVNDSPGVAAGGGVSIPASAGNATGATVSIADSVITQNRVAPRATFGEPAPCGGIPFTQCAFALGGGIDNSGTLTLTDSSVTGNVAGSAPGVPTGVASTANGGGIDNHPQGRLTMLRCRVTGNRAEVDAPDGRFSEGGGILDGGTMTIDASTVDGNASMVVSYVPSFFPFDVRQNADAGGVDVSVRATATISRSSISGNTVSDFDSGGDAQAFNGGIDVDGVLALTESRVERNSVTAEVPPGSGFAAVATSGGLGVAGAANVSASRLGDNSVSAVSPGGPAHAGGGGAGSFSGRLTLERSVVSGNDASASGVGGLLLGGGIISTDLGGGPPSLTLSESVVTANRLTAGLGYDPQGGGIFTDPNRPTAHPPVVTNTITRTVVAGNQPHQCVGC
jgi:hypothetical protein